MKKFTILQEAFKIGKDFKPREFKYRPIDRKELEELIKDLIEKRGPNADLNDIDISAIDDLSMLFYNNEKIREIKINEWNTTNVVDMQSMFSKSMVTKVDLSNWNITNVENARSMFSQCKYLKNVGNLDKWNIKKITNMKFMFSDCDNLLNVGDLSSWDVSNINTNYMFANCKRLKTIGDIKHWKIHKDVLLSNMFALSAIEPQPIKTVR